MKIRTVYDNSWRNPSFYAPSRRPVRWYEQSDSDEPREDGSGFTVEQLLGALDGTVEQKTFRRTVQVQNKWRSAVEKVYGPAAALVLAHTNAVYVMKRDDYLARKGKPQSSETVSQDVSRETPSDSLRIDAGESAGKPCPSDVRQAYETVPKVAIVYIDDATIRADVDAKQELLKLQLLKDRENVVEMKILASRFGMKERHPYEGYAGNPRSADASKSEGAGASVDISAESLSKMERILADVRDPLVKRRLENSINRNLRPYMKKK